MNCYFFSQIKKDEGAARSKRAASMTLELGKSTANFRKLQQCDLTALQTQRGLQRRAGVDAEGNGPDPEGPCA